MIPPLAAEVAAGTELLLDSAGATGTRVREVCAAAAAGSFYGICVAGSWVELARSVLEEAPVKVTALVGWPYGGAESDVKRFETETAADCGAHEIEAVIHHGRLQEGDRRFVLREMRDVVEAADERPVKLVVLKGVLTLEEIKAACELALDSGAKGISFKASAGMPTMDDVLFVRQALGPKFGLKASGELDEFTARLLLEAGATRIGIPG